MSIADTSTMIVDMRTGDALALAGVTVELLHKSGRTARLRVIAPRSLAIKKISSSDETITADVRDKHGHIATS